jgi:hypothetical protein
MITNLSGATISIEENISSLSGETILLEGNLNELSGQTVLLENNKEDISNKVSAVTSGSTDIQYPSAKCVYGLQKKIEDNDVAIAGALNNLNDRIDSLEDEIGDIESLLAQI